MQSCVEDEVPLSPLPWSVLWQAVGSITCASLTWCQFANTQGNKKCFPTHCR